MFEREQDWSQFLYCLQADKPVELISQHFGIHIAHVLHYRDMYRGITTLMTHGKLPENLRSYAIGFRFCSVIRWVMTPEIRRARAQYDLGLVELATGKAIVRDDPAYVLYAFPRKERAQRELYFAAPVLP